MYFDTIHISNTNYSAVKTALEQWIELYIEDLDPNLTFYIFKISETFTFIETNQTIGNKYFNFLINYLTYPDNQRGFISVKGFTIISDCKLYPKNFDGKPVQIYVSENDTEYDNVNAVLESGETYKIDFGRKTVKIDEEIAFEKPDISYKTKSPETIVVDKKKVKENQFNSKLKGFNRRFLWISNLYILSLLILSYLLYNGEYFEGLMIVFSLGLFMWIMIEHEFLKVNKHYLKMLSVALFLGLYGYFIAEENSDELWLLTSRSGLYFLLLYQILRCFFKLIFKREPKFDDKSKVIEDRIYSILLTIGSILLIFVI